MSQTLVAMFCVGAAAAATTAHATSAIASAVLMAALVWILAVRCLLSETVRGKLRESAVRIWVGCGQDVALAVSKAGSGTRLPVKANGT